MIKNYIVTSWRNLLRQRGRTLINLSGLTLGITCSLVLFLMVEHLSSFDKFHSKWNRIFRVVNQSMGNQGMQYQSGIPTVLPDAFRADFPEAEEVIFTSYRAGALVTVPQRNGQPKKYQEERGVVFTEPGFFRMFDRNVIEGDAQSSLDDPNEAVISRGLAKKYFGTEDAIGEVVVFENNEYKVSAVIEDAPNNTDFPFNLMLSYATIRIQSLESGWNSIWSDEQCYFLLGEGENIEALEQRMPLFTKKYLGESDFDKTEFSIQPLSELHYDDRYGSYSYNTVPREILFALGIVALVLVITACVNFINLSTAEAVKRSKEVGVRKSLGSTRGQLIFQFLGETVIVTVVAVLASIACAQLTLGFVNSFLEMELALDLLNNQSLWIYLGSLTIGVALLSGLYPAFVISGFKPAQVLKNQMSNKGSSGYLLRRALVILQFFISQLLIIVTLVIIAQMEFSEKKNLGFEKEAIVLVPIPEPESIGGKAAHAGKIRTLRDEVASLAGVEGVSLSNSAPASGHVSGTNFSMEGVTEEFGTQVKQVDGKYLDLYQLKLVAGRNISDLDSVNGYLVNEKLVRTAGFTHSSEILGKQLTVWGKTYPVVGVVGDFHTMSLRRPIEATVLFNSARGYHTLAVKVNMSEAQEAIEGVRKKWEGTYPEHLFEYEFLDESIRQFYSGQRKMSVLVGTFTTIAIFIGCLGLFGLATFMANQKTKEIGVRKVMGASVESIVLMFSKEFIRLICIGFLLAAPLAWLAMNAFLSEFAYKITPGPGIFLTGLIATMLIATLTVGYQCIRVSRANPVKSLRYE